MTDDEKVKSGSQQIKRGEQMKGYSRSTRAPFPDLCTLNTADEYMEGTEKRDNQQHTVTSDCKSSSTWKEQNERWTKGQQMGQTQYVYAWRIRLVQTPEDLW